MPDISMCNNQTCPDRAKCYRFTAAPNPWRQAYAMFAPPAGATRCEYFTPNIDQEARHVPRT
ncbi:MAG: hypothetical protein ACXWVD_00410 [Telluria sp.]